MSTSNAGQEGYLTTDIIHFCAVECKMQMSGEESVSWMVDAWLWALKQTQPPSPGKIATLGLLVEPHKNAIGFRRCGVRVGFDVKMDWERVDGCIKQLCSTYSLTPAEWFKEYENIHPFVDGNGRTGQILFNWLAGTLDKPTWAPNFWNDPRRSEGYGA